MEIKLDLHVHSAYSPDGRMEIHEIVEKAKARGLQGVAICDHDRVWTESIEEQDFLVIPGGEFSTEYGHLLGLFLTGPIEKGSFRETVEAIHAQGGLAVLAHPFARRTEEAALEGIAPLLDGIEVWNGRANRKNPQANAQAAAFAEAHGLCPFAGSDAHVPEEIGSGLVRLNVEALNLEAVRQALLLGGEISGRNSPHRYVAMSQLAKCRREKVGPAAYLKWGAFAVKCWGEDLFNRRDQACPLL